MTRCKGSEYGRPSKYSCKERDFSLLHHFRHRTKHRSRHFNHANIQIHFRYISTSGFSKLMQNTRAHILLLYYTVIHRYWPTHVETPIFQCNLVSRLYALRSVRNLYHRKDLLLTSRFEYKLDMVWIRGSEVIGCPKYGYELTPDLHRSHSLLQDLSYFGHRTVQTYRQYLAFGLSLVVCCKFVGDV